jgi:PAS domain-containing protein
MRQDHLLQQGDATLLATPASAFPGSSSSPFASANVDSYFDLRRDGVRSPTSIQSTASSVELQTTPTTTSTALAALQYLPMPVLVLNSVKTVVLANEAMGRLLGIDSSELGNDKGPVATITDVLQGQPMSQLGIEILAHGSPILISWEVSQAKQEHYGLESG